MRDHLRTRDAIEHDAQLDVNVRIVDRVEGSARRSAALTVADTVGGFLDDVPDDSIVDAIRMAYAQRGLGTTPNEVRS